jgi:signal-transduction protein with cAMP-binding, CBS, and nucleotidyltransferase domain
MKARDIMTSPVFTVAPDAQVKEIAAMLFERRISAVPVVAQGALIGIVSEADLLHRQEIGTADAAPSGDDQSIRRKLLQELEQQEWWRLDRANVIVTDGVVHFWGMVESDDARPAARVAAENVPGVRGVDDHRFISYNAPTMT